MGAAGQPAHQPAASLVAAQFALNGGADDKVFRLERVDNELCKSLIKDGDEVAALQAK